MKSSGYSVLQMALSEIKGVPQMLFIKPWDPKDAQGESSAISAEGREIISKNLWI